MAIFNSQQSLNTPVYFLRTRKLWITYGLHMVVESAFSGEETFNRGPKEGNTTWEGEHVQRSWGRKAFGVFKE